VKAAHQQFKLGLNGDKNLDGEVEEFLKGVDRHLEPYLKRAANRIPNVPALKDGVTYQIRTGGKRIRAALCATSCELFSGSYLRALSFASAIEHLQNFMLVHDDIADGDEERRAQESIWRRFGIGHGINIGDIFVSLSALSVLESTYSPELKLKLLHIISQYGLEIAEGQSLDINLRSTDSPTVDAYLRCTQKKTGSFMAMATVGGAVIGGANEDQIGNLRAFGRRAGIAFQIKDDVLDINGDKGRTIGSDIMEGKRTLLVIHAATNCLPLERRRLFRILNKPRSAKTLADVQWVCKLYEKIGAVTYAEQFTENLIDEAVKRLASLPETQAKYKLVRISKYLSKRMH
jgi:geranylgeranyl pyrophosphate synthase